MAGAEKSYPAKKKLYQIARALRARDDFKNSNGEIRFKDYITAPKEDGYRGYHLIGTFKDSFGQNKLIELQLRTTIQLDWSTALEIVDLFTGQALKSNKGNEDWKNFFRLVSLHFSIMETIHLFSSISQEEQLSQYRKKVMSDNESLRTGKKINNFESTLKVVKNIEAFAHSLRIADQHISEKKVSGYVLLKVDTVNSRVSSTLFNDDQNDEAEKMYLEYEKEASSSNGIVVALVSTTAVGGIKEAYPNYFADSSDFLRYLMLILRVQKMQRKPTLLERILEKSGL